MKHLNEITKPYSNEKHRLFNCYYTNKHRFDVYIDGKIENLILEKEEEERRRYLQK